MFSCIFFSVITHLTAINNNINNNKGALGPLTNNQGALSPLSDNQGAPSHLMDNQWALRPLTDNQGAPGPNWPGGPRALN